MFCLDQFPSNQLQRSDQVNSVVTGLKSEENEIRYWCSISTVRNLITVVAGLDWIKSMLFGELSSKYDSVLV